MRKIFIYMAIIVLLGSSLYGCAALIIGSAVGALGGYAVSRDTIQAETDKAYNSIWDSALAVSRARGNIRQKDASKGFIELEIDANQVWIRVVRLSRTMTRLKVSARRYYLPNIDLAQDIFVKIMEEAR